MLLPPPRHGRRASVSFRCPLTVLLQIGFTWPPSRQGAGGLLPRLSTLTENKSRRYLSVALSLKSPSVGVTHNPALRSPDFPHARPFGTCARNCLTYSIGILYKKVQFVKGGRVAAFKWYCQSSGWHSLKDMPLKIIFYRLF